MAKKAKGKKKAAKKKTAKKKAVKKKATKKKTAKKKAVAKKKTVKKKATKKKTAKKKAAKAKPVRKQPVKAKPMVAPGPATMVVPPLEEPASNEEAVGTITHYYSHLNVAVVQLNKGTLRSGDTIHIKGSTTDFTQPVESMEFEHQHIDQTSAGQSFGLKVKDHAREHDIVYRVK